MKTKISTKVLSFMMALILMLGNIPAFEVKAASSSVSGDVLTYYFNGEERQQTFSDSFLGSCYFYVDDYYETTVAIVTSENNINSCTKLASADTIIFADSFAEEVDGIITAWHFTATNNSGLKELYLPNGITIISSSLCASKYNLKKVQLGNAVTEIQASAFSGCSSLADINIPSTVTLIGNSAFFNTKITSLNMPSSLQTIGNQAFQSCDTFNWNFTENCLPNVTSIGTSAFEGTDVAGEISRITLPSLTTIGAKAFKATKVSKLVVSPEITSIGDDAFTECTLLDLALIENGVQNVTTSGSASAPKWFGSTYATVAKTVVSESYGSKWPTGTINRLNVVYPGRLKITILGDSPYIVTPEETVELGLTSIKLAKTHYTKTDDSGNPIISSYQWYESDTMPTGDISSASGTEISGATTDKLTVYLDTAGTKYYFCKVTVDNGDKFDAYDNYSAVFTFTVEQGEQVVDIQAPNKEFDNSAYDESNIVVTSTTSNTPVITWYDSSKQELTEAPAAVGTYFIKVAIAGNESYLDYESDYIQVEINKGKLNPTVTAETSDYTSEPYDADSLVKVENINSLYTGDYELVYFSTNDNTSTPIACPTAPDTYYVSAKFAGDDSFEALTTEPVEFVINKDKPTFSISEKSQVYDGTEFSMTASVSKSAFEGSPAPASQDLTFNYYEKNGNDYDRLPYVPVNAGTYYVEAVYAGDAHYGEAKSEMVKITIEPTVPAISIKDDVTTVTYDGNEVKPDYTTTGISESDRPTGDVTYEYYTDAECKSKATAPKNAGTYYVKAVIAAKGNYKKAVSEPAKLVIEKADITATMTISGITYNGKPLPVTLKGIGEYSGQKTVKFKIYKRWFK